MSCRSLKMNWKPLKNPIRFVPVNGDKTHLALEWSEDFSSYLRSLMNQFIGLPVTEIQLKALEYKAFMALLDYINERNEGESF